MDAKTIDTDLGERIGSLLRTIEQENRMNALTYLGVTEFDFSHMPGETYWVISCENARKSSVSLVITLNYAASFLKVSSVHYGTRMYPLTQYEDAWNHMQREITCIKDPQKTFWSSASFIIDGVFHSAMTTHLGGILLEAIHVAAEVHARYFQKKNILLTPKFGGDGSQASEVVTKADIESEKALRAYFADVLPDYNIFGEEFGAAYNGNGKVIVIDPLDGSKNFVKGVPKFGTIIGVYENGKNIASISCNTTSRNGYVATLDHGFSWFGPPEDPVEEEMIILNGSLLEHHPSLTKELHARVSARFPECTVYAGKSDILNKDRVFAKRSAVYFHAGLGRHDIAAVPLFSQLTGVSATDHNGIPYALIDAAADVRKYADGSKAVVYSYPLLVAQPAYLERMLDALIPLKEALDQVQHPKF